MLPATSDPPLSEQSVRLAEKLGERFGVTVTPTKCGYNMYTGKGEMLASNMPDAFFLWGIWRELIDNGTCRAIPISMIRQYAPKYADILAEPEFATTVMNMSAPGEDGVVYGLMSYNKWNALAQMFSLYRLDWLEQIGVVPNGTVTEVGERIFFTDQPFTKSQFYHIMLAFSDLKNDRIPVKKYGLAIETPDYFARDDYYDAFMYNSSLMVMYNSSLMGMWGLNPFFTHVDGQIELTPCTDKFREYMGFIQWLTENGAIMPSKILSSTLFDSPQLLFVQGGQAG